MGTTDKLLDAVAARVNHIREENLYYAAAAAAVDELAHNWRDWSRHNSPVATAAGLRQMALADIARTMDALDGLSRAIAGIRD